MNFISVVSIIAVCCLSISAAQNSGNPPLTENEKLAVNGINALGINLLKVLLQAARTEENVLFSPTSIYQALALLHLASNGKTRNEIAQTMGLPQDDSKVTAIHETISQISKKIQSKPENAYDAFSELTMATGLFVQQNFPIKPEFVKQVLGYYSGNVTNLDFAKKSKEATDAINQWVSEKTKGRIPQLYKEPLNPTTLTVLTSSLYFNGKWKEPFPASKTKVENFNTGSKTVKVQMMNDQQVVRYVSSPEWKSDAIVLPYAGGEYHMLIILPNRKQTLKNLTYHLNDVDKLHGIVMKTDFKGVDYKIPRIKFSWTKALENYLPNLGLKNVFRQADLTNMVPANFSLKVSGVNHAAEIESEEKGTQASSVTGVQIEPVSLTPPPKNPIQFYVNRPFWFCIYYQPKHIIPFAGVVYNPAQN